MPDTGKRAVAERAFRGARRFKGAVATTGNSRGFRIEKAFFSAAPEFEAVGSAISVDVIGPGTILVHLDALPPDETTGDPLIAAWLSFIEQDIRSNPARLQVLSEATAAALEDLVKGVAVDDNEILPDDVTI